ncbi:hypothetical protein LCI18_015027 [Fusarium solani-melongenae]|uniref:Uncharacterized protein n=1 Tax=Fusarium solani subsp. cucurbitae TaxID=2747967 RepID=A0ACD3ZSI0_FUSSC|nr:hypothetical protein LCI18_015027 [Fusarium solani-melongenae]
MPSRDDDELRRMSAALDRLFFDRCIGGLKSMPLMTCLLLASPHPHDAHSRPFGPLQEKTSMDRYLVYVKRFLCYCLNVLSLGEDALLAEHGFRFTHAQRASLEQLWAHLQDEEQSSEGLQEEILQILADFWMQRLDGDPFASPLWHFVGVRDAWLCKATYSPMGYTLSLLLYGRKIAQETSSRLMVSWSKHGEMMYFMGKPILMEDIRHMVARMMKDAEDLLWGQLMFKEGDDERFIIPLAGIEDDLTQIRRGRSFIYTNDLIGKEVEMLEDLVMGSRKAEFLDRAGEWK